MTASIGSGSFAAQDLTAMRQNRFKKTDGDGDGKITKDELKTALPENGKGPSVDDIFSKVDTNQDGAIDETEDAAAMEKQKGSGPRGAGGQPDPAKMAAQLFKKADADTDGKLSLGELSKVLPKDDQGQSVEDLFKAADSDEDGAITESELAESLKKMLEEMAAKRAADAKSGNAHYDQKGTKKSDDASRFSAVA